jgi:hypothetical protein
MTSGRILADGSVVAAVGRHGAADPAFARGTPAPHSSALECLGLDCQVPLDPRQLGVTQTGPVVLPPDVVIDDPTRHPTGMSGEHGNLKGRRRDATRRRFETPTGRRLEAPLTVVTGTSLQEYRGGSQPFRCDYCGSNQRSPDPFPFPIRPNAEWAQDQYVDQLSPCVEPPKAQPDMADGLNTVDGDETRLREPSGNHVAPQGSDIPVVSKRLGDHPVDGVTLASSLRSYLHDRRFSPRTPDSE